MVNGRNRLDMMLNEEFKLLSKAIQPIEVKFQPSLKIKHRSSLLFKGDYRKWETGRTEPIRHDGGYVRLFR